MRIVTGSEDGSAIVWDVGTKDRLLDLKGHRRGVRSVRFSPDGRQIACDEGGPKSTAAKIWDATTGQELLTLRHHTEQITGVAFSADGKRIVSGSWDKTVTVLDAGGGP